MPLRTFLVFSLELSSKSGPFLVPRTPQQIHVSSCCGVGPVESWHSNKIRKVWWTNVTVILTQHFCCWITVFKATRMPFLLCTAKCYCKRSLRLSYSSSHFGTLCDRTPSRKNPFGDRSTKMFDTLPKSQARLRGRTYSERPNPNEDSSQKPQVFRDPPENSSTWRVQETTKKPQIFTEDRKCSQIGVRHLRSVTSNAALKSTVLGKSLGFQDLGGNGSAFVRPEKAQNEKLPKFFFSARILHLPNCSEDFLGIVSWDRKTTETSPKVPAIFTAKSPDKSAGELHRHCLENRQGKLPIGRLC